LYHTFAAWLVMDGRPLPEVRAFLGQSVIKMTKHYAYLPPENFVNAVSSTEGRPHFGPSADNNWPAQGDASPRVIDLMDKKWWAQMGSS
jgi:hypothetical protein